MEKQERIEKAKQAAIDAICAYVRLYVADAIASAVGRPRADTSPTLQAANKISSELDNLIREAQS